MQFCTANSDIGVNGTAPTLRETGISLTPVCQNPVKSVQKPPPMLRKNGKIQPPSFIHLSAKCIVRLVFGIPGIAYAFSGVQNPMPLNQSFATYRPIRRTKTFSENPIATSVPFADRNDTSRPLWRPPMASRNDRCHLSESLPKERNPFFGGYLPLKSSGVSKWVLSWR